MKKISSKQLDELRRIHAKLAELLAAFEEGPVDVPAEIAAQVKAKLEAHICLACGLVIESGDKTKRGQHAGCYSTTRARIARGEYTEESQILIGKLTAEGKKAGRPAKQDLAADKAVAAEATETLNKAVKKKGKSL